MSMRSIGFLPLAFASILMCGAPACRQRVDPVPYLRLEDGRYDTAFPHDASRELQKLTETVRKVYFSAFYEKYIFPVHLEIEYSDSGDLLLNEAMEPIPITHSVSGTATVISCKDRRIALLSCAHIFASPDTIVTYYDDESSADYVQSIAIKNGQKITVPGFPSGTPWRLLVQDRERDIAVLGREFPFLPKISVAVFDYPFGRGKELGWGTLIYLLGYPRRVKTITSGIVSQPDRDGEGSFTTDALFSSGSSGGIVLAVRDGSPHFERVGMAVSVSGFSERVLAPAEDKDFDETAAPLRWSPSEPSILLDKR